MHGGSAQGDVYNKCQENGRQVDGPTAALITDLKERGLFEDTLIIWASEFGRTPMKQGSFGGRAGYFGRDHHPKGYTVWMAGAGIKPGITYGATDEWGYWAVEGKTSPLDVFATALHQFGINHEKFTYQFQGRPYRLTFGTQEQGHVIKDILV
jgi:arylsulfatase A-like enzyme